MSLTRRLALTAATVGVTAGTLLSAGTAGAAPLIHCKGALCTNRGDSVGIGHGMYACPNGLQYPSIAIVPPHSSAWVFPANCGQPRLY
ncbi:hypothetical protein [Gordonia crocea]|uniref:Secreted protein n=1 Tax=Gordonia crocea TaxID=589162 RepID=A0A7I9V1T2_9ACTN|nr:hypothetical protein [Gordonia crocea]GED99146.1 hypothetical protein nbrc107697_31850 [Gordonia crocea]